jgi:LuxR family glucitol operon transcriptional activator
MNSPNLTELINTVNVKVLAYTGKSLTDVQKQILEQALDGKKLKDIQVCGYSETTVQRVFCPQLWHLLSEALGQKLRLKTIRLTLEKTLQNSTDILQHTQVVSDQLSSDQKLSSNPSKQVLHNLPAPTCTTFIGRTEELNRLLELLSPHHAAHLISVDGVGGVGKTTFVLEAAYQCLRASRNPEISQTTAPIFDVIIFTSAKEQRLTSVGLLNSLSPQRTLNDIFRQITRVIEEVWTVGASLIELELIQAALARYRTLLIVDNLETVTDQEEVLAFLYELPSTVKVVITTRKQIIFVPVRLTPMLEQDGLTLICHEAQEKGVWLEESDRLQLYQATGGIPVAISYAIGQLASGYSVAEIFHQLKQPTGDVAQFCFANSVQPLRGKPAHYILMALTLFPAPALLPALIQVAVPQVDQDTTQQEIARLRGFSLVRQENHRYSMLTLTREYALAELNANPEFRRDARQRWLNWYMDFSATYGKADIDEWSGYGFDQLTAEWQNLQAVMEWCITEGRYTEALQLWQNLETYTQFRGRNISRLGFLCDRALWTGWLMEMAKKRGDWRVLTQVTLDYIWTLVAIAKPESLKEAEDLLMQIWNFRHHQDSLFQANLAKSMAVLYLSQSRFNEAQAWLNQAEILLKEFPQPDNPMYNRLSARLPCYQGIIFFEIGAYEQAQEKYTLALNLAHQLHWVRHTFIIQCCLAEIAIEQKRLDDAQLLLKDGLYMAEVNHDRTYMAYCQRALAKLAYAQDNMLEAMHWGTAAFKTFDALAMKLEATKTQALITLWIDSKAITFNKPTIYNSTSDCNSSLLLGMEKEIERVDSGVDSN